MNSLLCSIEERKIWIALESCHKCGLRYSSQVCENTCCPNDHYWHYCAIHQRRIDGKRVKFNEDFHSTCICPYNENTKKQD